MIEYLECIEKLEKDGGALAKRAAKLMKELVEMHQYDMAELVNLRRQIGALNGE